MPRKVGKSCESLLIDRSVMKTAAANTTKKIPSKITRPNKGATQENTKEDGAAATASKKNEDAKKKASAEQSDNKVRVLILCFSVSIYSCFRKELVELKQIPKTRQVKKMQRLQISSNSSNQRRAKSVEKLQ